MADFAGIADALMKGKAPEVKELVDAAVKEGVPPGEILSEGLIAGMSVIGVRFKNNEVYVPEVLIAARAMHAGMDVLKPLLAEAGIEPKGVFALGTVKGDLHDIGKNLVLMMMEGAGYEVNDLGVDVAPEKFVDAVNDGAQIIGMSALLTTTMPAMKTAIETINAAGVRDKVKIMVGGAPLTQAFADEIGADGFAPDAASAVDTADELLTKA
ncbi:MAG: corrinoid protein [Candidatus Latescibacteria bacterium]|jgi:5-methyltetrahydrofolate--homocysteine methyltransferase|nr:corrinoid protein [Candidatus Latescibacterota bacterium]